VDSTAKAALQRGNIDIIEDVSNSDVPVLQGTPNVKVAHAPVMSMTALLMQTKDPVLANPKMRQALAHAIDYQQLAAAVTEGLAQPNNSIVPLVSPYYDAAQKQGWNYDPALAQKLLGEAGYKGQDLTILTTKRYPQSYNSAVIIRAMFQAVAAQVDGQPCCQWLGEGGAGHYVKMVHNGIEYGDMQLIAEACHLMQHALGMSHVEMADTFAAWNSGRLESYLIEITGHILLRTDSDGSPLVEKILDRAGQKGTGVWTAQDALEHAVPLTLIAEAVHARMLSARKDERVAAAALIGGRAKVLSTTQRAEYLGALCDALYASKLVSYAQGFALLQAGAEKFGWHLPYGEIALLWRAGCIIRSRFLADIKTSFAREPVPLSLLQDSFFAAEMKQAEPGWRKAVILAVAQGVAAPALASALSYYDGYRCANGSANILQAQRDYFGAHGYQRVDRAERERFHTHWLGDGAEERLS